MKLELFPEEVVSVASFDPGERRVSIIADTTRGLGAVRMAAEGMGARIIFNGEIADALLRLSDGVLGDAILVDIADDQHALLDVFLDRLDAAGRFGRVPIIINSAPECLDTVCAALTAPNVTFLSQASAVEWISALALCGPVSDTMLHEVASDDSLRLQRLADEVDRIARTLADLAGNAPVPLRGVSDAGIGFRAEPAMTRAQPDILTAADLRGMIRLRRMRDRYFRGDLFADPAWDMLLDLMAARLERIRVAVSSLCIAAAVPPTTALRWIGTMTDSGMLVRVADAEDGRRVFIELSEAAASAMTTYLSAVKRQGGLAV